MKKIRKILPCFVIGLSLLLVFSNVASALEILLEPANAQREIDGKVRVHIYANNAVDLISMGVKVSFDPSVLQVQSASKYDDVENGWVMDADGDSATTDDQYTTPSVEIDNTNGSVTMIGGRLTGSSTQGLSGKVLLGWIVFEAIDNGVSLLNVDLGKYHPEHPSETFVNFAKLDQSADQPTNVPDDLGAICVIDSACYADQDGDGDVDMADSLKHRLAAPSIFPLSSNYNPAADIDADGDVDMADKLRFRLGSPRNDCPVCP